MSTSSKKSGKDSPRELNSNKEMLEISCHRFRIEFLRVTDPNTRQGIILHSTIARSLNAYRLSGLFSVTEILNETYTRGVRANQKREIENVPGWIRCAGRNVVAEWSRKDRRSISADEFLANYPAVEPLSTEELGIELKKVRIATQRLKPRDQRILELKVVKKLPWNTVQTILREEGFGDCHVAALRKRKERALNRLRRLYHEVVLDES